MNKPKRVVRIQWTKTAVDCLSRLPKDVQAGLLDKADELKTCSDPRTAHKPLQGPLRGYCRMTYGRYRAIFRVDEEHLASGEVLIVVVVTFVAAGIRKEQSKEDVYRLAQKAAELGLLAPGLKPQPEKSKSTSSPSKATPRRRRNQ